MFIVNSPSGLPSKGIDAFCSGMVISKTKSKYKELKLFENQSLFETASSNTTFLEAFKFMDNNIASYIKNN